MDKIKEVRGGWFLTELGGVTYASRDKLAIESKLRGEQVEESKGKQADGWTFVVLPGSKPKFSGGGNVSGRVTALEKRLDAVENFLKENSTAT